jgi:hypothetical protein
MQETVLRFQTLNDLIHFKQYAEVKELRIDTAEKSLTGRFTETDLQTAVEQFKASMFDN